MSSVYFPNLNGLRFIAAVLVIIAHVEQIKSIRGFSTLLGTSDFFDVAGKLGVVLFFVLSGFLITYLLVSEEEKKGTISIGKFYIRRMLRIWPLYFIITLSALLVLPNVSALHGPVYSSSETQSDLLVKLLLVVFLLPNLLVAIYSAFPYAAHTWSIGTEEQFYLVWPVILRYSRRYRITTMVVIILAYLAISWAFRSEYLDFVPGKEIVTKFLNRFNVDCMAIGGIFAILLHRGSNLLKVIFDLRFFYGVLLLTLALVGFGVSFPRFHYDIYGLLFAIIIINMAANNRVWISLEFPLLNYFGKISYGIYMYHPLVVVLVLIWVPSAIVQDTWLAYFSCILGTIVVAAISYEFLEKPFINWKRKFTNIQSGEKTSKPSE